MLKYHRIKEEIIAAELTGSEFIINDVQDVLDLMAEAGSNGCSSLIVSSNSLNAGFFDLKTGIAGEILQKFSNYRVRLAIIGDFTLFKSNSLRDFIRECNRGGFIIFCEDVNSSLKKFESNNSF
jgi:hypothetical protein